jgi:DNA-binding MarR family transcriptional regulator
MSTGHDLAMALRCAYLVMHRLADASLARFGVTADQFVLLAALDESDALTQKDLARLICSDASTVRAMLVLLEGRGLVSRDPHPSDGRARSVALTPSGRRSFRKMYEGSEEFREKLLAALAPDEADILCAILRCLTQGLSTPEGKPAGADNEARE